MSRVLSLVPSRVAWIVAAVASAEFMAETVLAGAEGDALRFVVMLVCTPLVFVLAALAETIKVGGEA